jgi:two-component system copper resistance phosphate regulon response regulator CusR
MTSSSSPRILLVEDEVQTATAVSKSLEQEGFQVSWSPNGSNGLRLLASNTFDAVILDWMVPELSGLDLLKKLRKEGKKVPVLLLTARDAVEDRIRGLDTGADDYLVKPFALAELAARVRALVRRGSNLGDTPRVWKIDGLEVDEYAHSVKREETVIALTAKEWQILVLLLRNANRVVSRETLAHEVWPGMNRATPLDNVIDVHLANLRRKLEDGQTGRLIQTIRGVGFLLRSPQS